MNIPLFILGKRPGAGSLPDAHFYIRESRTRMSKGFKKFKKHYWPWMKNKFVLTGFGFLVWMSFFDRNDFITTWSYRRKLNELEAQRDYYRDAIRNNKASLQLLETDPENLERYAREEHLMKRDNEDVYVIVDAA
ncbi:MAG: FtsB family cell division protein, partial [Bacteroidota bacterium]